LFFVLVIFRITSQAVPDSEARRLIKMEDEIDYKKCEVSQKILDELSKIQRHGKAEFIEWLKSTDFFIAPCSKGYHLNIKGGLAQHSWNVYQLFSEKNQRYKLGLSLDTVIICGLLHDVCKIAFYRRKKKWDNEKRKKTWQYGYEDKFPVGHGEKSVIILQRFFRLSEQECCIIRWHMAGFDISPYGKPAHQRAVEMYPACIALHTADYESASFLENKDEPDNNGGSQ